MKCGSPYQQIDRMGFAKEYPCGRCLNCRINRAEEWTTRIKLELEDRRQQGDFLTLTFDDKRSTEQQQQLLTKRELQLFFKRLRKAGHKLKYFACGEYGEKHERAHYHAIVIRGDEEPTYDKFWQFGDVFVGTVTSASARYVTGYLTKSNAIPPGKGTHPPFQLQSQGMGKEWAKKHRHDVKEQIQWQPRYIVEITRQPNPPTQTPTRHFTSQATLTQRLRNTQAKSSQQA